MSDRLTEDDMRRIEQFAQRPAYERQPDQLLPDGAGSDEESAD